MKNSRLTSAVGATLVTAGLTAVGAGAVLASTTTSATAAGTDNVYVCKWKKTPDGETEEIKPGKNPIVTSVQAVPGFDGTFPSYFGDAQTLSVVLGYAGPGYPVITLADCLANPPIDPDPTETVTTTAPTETVTVTEPTDDTTTTTTATANPKPSDETETTDPETTDPETGDPEPTSNPKPADETDPAPEDPPTAVDAGIGAPAPAVTDEGSQTAVALGGAGGLMTLAGGLLLVGARRRGDQEA